MAHRILDALLGASMTAGAVTLVWLAVSQVDRRPPLAFESQEFVQAEASPGQVVTLIARRTRIRWCPGMIYEWWRHENGVSYQGDQVHASPTTELGYLVDRFPKVVPNMPPGRVCYEPLAAYQCPDGEHVIRPPPACLVVR